MGFEQCWVKINFQIFQVIFKFKLRWNKYRYRIYPIQTNKRQLLSEFCVYCAFDNMNLYFWLCLSI